MLTALSLMAAGPIEAERAYAALAQEKGQWTAFRATAAPDALMFVPEPARAAEWLAGRQDPRVSVVWWPARSWMSCDGRLAVNYGPWVRPGGRVGTFATVWTRTETGWRWRLDGGDAAEKPVAASDRPQVTRASCRRPGGASAASLSGDASPDALFTPAGKAGAAAGADWRKGRMIDSGASPDRTLRWEVREVEGRGPTSHVLLLWRWNGTALRLAFVEATDPPSR
ncbi:MAG TPA: hypothetical protein VH331_00935 [Allosphingosinicella sp.]|jgi:hypothetical protein|nr:hypothetical protein [Allosphingosinicella sp.]